MRGLHQEDQSGSKDVQTFLTRLSELDLDNEYVCCQKCSQIINYAYAKEMADIQINQNLTYWISDAETDALTVGD